MINYIEKNFPKIKYCGIDGVNEGGIFGVLIGCGMILKKDIEPVIAMIIKDSKKTKTKQRRYEILSACASSIEFCDVVIIDNDYINKTKSIHKSDIFMTQRIIKHLKDKCDAFLCDNLEVHMDALTYQVDNDITLFQQAESKSINVALASILAKYTLDLYEEEIKKRKPAIAKYFEMDYYKTHHTYVKNFHWEFVRTIRNNQLDESITFDKEEWKDIEKNVRTKLIELIGKDKILQH